MIESGTVQPNFTFVWGLSFSKFIHSTSTALRSDPQALRKSPWLEPRPVVAVVIVVAASESYKIVYYSRLNG